MHLRFALACSLFVALSACNSSPPLETAPNVDLSRFQGKWFEIAKLPRVTQANCTATTTFYTFHDNGIDVVNQCHVDRLDGELRTRTARATVTDDPARLSLDIAGFTGDFWILEVGEHYEYAVIGTPSRDYLWILGRTATLPQTTIDGILSRMQAKKFDTSKLEYTLQAPTSP